VFVWIRDQVDLSPVLSHVFAYSLEAKDNRSFGVLPPGTKMEPCKKSLAVGACGAVEVARENCDESLGEGRLVKTKRRSELYPPEVFSPTGLPHCHGSSSGSPEPPRHVWLRPSWFSLLSVRSHVSDWSLRHDGHTGGERLDARIISSNDTVLLQLVEDAKDVRRPEGVQPLCCHTSVPSPQAGASRHHPRHRRHLTSARSRLHSRLVTQGSSSATTLWWARL